MKHGRTPLIFRFYMCVENPYEAAQQFLLKNDLPSSYVDEVVRFIEKSTGGATLGGPGGVDPYTGTSSYRSGGPAQPSAPSQGSFSGDPWSRSSSSTAGTANLLPHVSDAPELVTLWAQSLLDYIFRKHRLLSLKPTLLQYIKSY